MKLNNEASKVGVAVLTQAASRDDESGIFINSVRNNENGGQIFSRYHYKPEVTSTADLLDSSAQSYGNNRCFGERKILNDGSYGEYQWITYKEAREKVLNFAAGLNKLGINKGDKVGIYSHNCMWYQLTQFAVHYLGAVLVPVYDSLGPDAAQYIVEHSECKIIVAHNSKLDNATAISSPFLKHVITISDSNDALTCNSIEMKGREFKLHREKVGLHDLAMIMYTSGSTGEPKGCMISHQNLIAGGIGLGGMNTSVTEKDVFFSFLPLAHIYEICCEVTLLCQGAAIGFYTGDVRNLVSDMMVLRPTIMCGVPRVFNKLADNFRKRIAELPRVKRSLVHWAIAARNAEITSGKASSIIVDHVLLSAFKRPFGGRIRLIVSGGAPILPEVYELIRAVVTPNIIQGYGLTEASATGTVQQCGELDSSCVGPPSITVDMKFKAVPGMSYDPKQMYPSGEILLRGPSIFMGYYKKPELTEQVLKDGWFYTGDIGTLLPSGSIKIVDRAKQLVKLSQGEYISITTLSDIYGATEGVQSIFIYADSLHNQPVAVVVPTNELEEKWKRFSKSEDERMKEIIDNMGKRWSDSRLRGFERITKIFIDHSPFTIENGLLTPSFKPKLDALKNKYETKLKDLIGSN